MGNHFKILKNNQQLGYEAFVFPAGEVSVKLDMNNYRYYYDKADHQTIVARIQCSDDLLKLALLKNALDEVELQRKDNEPRIRTELFMPYVPYGRQDRICDKGESFSLKVFGKYINSLGFSRVTVMDPHSSVTPAVIDNVNVISQFDVINSFREFNTVAAQCLLVSPDAGSNKKTSEIAKFYNHSEFIRADKLRDLATGKIIETKVYCDDLGNRDVVIVDDLCEKGGTFILLAKALKQRNCGRIFLFVTHGIFSGNLDDLYNNGIDEIFTTDSYRENLVETPKMHILKVQEKFATFI